MERLSYFINKKIHYVLVERTKNKNMYLKIKENEIICSAPKRTKDKIIKAFVDQHINKFIEYMAKAKSNMLYSLQEDFLFLFGKKYFFKRLNGFKTRKIEILNNSLYFKTSNSENDDVEFLIKKHLKASLNKYLIKSQANYEKIMKQNKHNVKTTYKTTTWGSNYINKNTIIYSTRLAHYRTEIIDYVIVHELAHSIQPDHSSLFWKIVEMHCPNYKLLRKELRADSSMQE